MIDLHISQHEYTRFINDYLSFNQKNKGYFMTTDFHKILLFKQDTFFHSKYYINAVDLIQLGSFNIYEFDLYDYIDAMTSTVLHTVRHGSVLVEELNDGLIQYSQVKRSAIADLTIDATGNINYVLVSGKAEKYLHKLAKVAIKNFSVDHLFFYDYFRELVPPEFNFYNSDFEISKPFKSISLVELIDIIANEQGVFPNADFENMYTWLTTTQSVVLSGTLYDNLTPARKRMVSDLKKAKLIK